MIVWAIRKIYNTFYSTLYLTLNEFSRILPQLVKNKCSYIIRNRREVLRFIARGFLVLTRSRTKSFLYGKYILFVVFTFTYLMFLVQGEERSKVLFSNSTYDLSVNESHQVVVFTIGDRGPSLIVIESDMFGGILV